jgi:dihydrofolate reductase
MDTDMQAKQLPLTLIVAATPKNGIGKNGALPWPLLKKEMAYFARVTKRIPLAAGTGKVESKQTNAEDRRQNVVIMGRKTWESIPVRFRPLKDRTNIVISTKHRTQLEALPEDVVVTADILSGLQHLDKLIHSGKAHPVGRAFVIGGSSIYEAAMRLPQTKSVLLTRILREYDCDTVFPEDLDGSQSEWKQASHEDLESFIGEEIPPQPITEGEGETAVSFEYRLYQRSR